MSKFVTNQNIEIDLELASLGERILAFFIDALVIFGFMIMISMIFSSAGETLLVIILIPFMFYSLFFEYFGNGQSLGKKAMNIKVVKMDGTTPTIGAYLLRWLFRLIDIYILYGGVSVLSIIVTENGQRIGDLAAGTIVIKVRNVEMSAILKSPAKDDHIVSFPIVKQLTDQQIELMKKALEMRRQGFNKEGVSSIAEKLKEKFQIQTDLPDVKFLYTIIADYEYIANQEF
ncbi:MAG: RDD family protein [Cyclobacteriaceae bacterium]